METHIARGGTSDLDPRKRMDNEKAIPRLA